MIPMTLWILLTGVRIRNSPMIALPLVKMLPIIIFAKAAGEIQATIFIPRTANDHLIYFDVPVSKIRITASSINSIPKMIGKLM